MRELAYLRGLLSPQIPEVSMIGYLRWSSMILDALAAILLGLGPMAVPRVGWTDSWCLTSGYPCGLILPNMSFKEIILIIVQSF